MVLKTKLRIKRRDISSPFLIGLLALAILVGAMLAALIYYSLPALSVYGLSIYADNQWNPSMNRFGGLAAIYGTFLVSLTALIIAMPLAIGSAVFINEYVPGRLRDYLTTVNDMMAGFPTVIYGFWGLYVLGPMLNSTVFNWLHNNLGFIPLFSTKPLGGSYLLASVVLAIMITPFASSLVREVYAQIPIGIIEGIHALGLSRWDAIRIKLSYIRRAIIGALTLALGRGIGETVAVALTVGGALRISPSLLSPGITIPSLIANQFGSAYTLLEQSAMFSLALLLLVIGASFIALSRLLVLRGGAW